MPDRLSDLTHGAAHLVGVSLFFGDFTQPGIYHQRMTTSSSTERGPGFRPAWTPGDIMRKARLSVGMSQQELADRLGEDVNTVRRVEGDASPIKPARVAAWAWATGVDPAWINDEIQRSRRDSNPKPSDREPRRMTLILGLAS